MTKQNQEIFLSKTKKFFLTLESLELLVGSTTGGFGSDFKADINWKFYADSKYVFVFLLQAAAAPQNAAQSSLLG